MELVPLKRNIDSLLFLPYHVSYQDAVPRFEKILKKEKKCRNPKDIAPLFAALWTAANSEDDTFYHTPVFRGQYINEEKWFTQMCRPYIKLLFMLGETDTPAFYSIVEIISSVAPFDAQAFTKNDAGELFMTLFCKQLIDMLDCDMADFVEEYLNCDVNEAFSYIHLLGNIFFQNVSSGQKLIPPLYIKNFRLNTEALSKDLKHLYKFITGDADEQEDEIDKQLKEILGGLFHSIENAVNTPQPKQIQVRHPQPVQKSVDIVENCRRWLNEWNLAKLREHFNKYIIGQPIATREAAIVLYEHVYRIAHPESGIRKKNYIMFGPTGCGKTEIMRVMKGISPVPVIISNASGLTAAGYKGTNVQELMDSAAEQEGNCRYAIMFLDEFDKLAGHGGDLGSFRQTVQQDILKLLEGEFRFGPKSPLGPADTYTSENITFICGGAFDGAFHIEKKKPGIGFTPRVESEKNGDVFAKLIEYGLIPEIVGRVNSVIPLRALNEQDMYDILTKSENSPITATKNLFKQAYNVTVVIPDAVLHAMCEFSVEQQLGARLLNTVLDMACHKAYRRACDAGKNPKRISLTDDDIKQTIDEFAVSEQYSRKPRNAEA